MISYRYKAISKDGKEVKGVLEAYDEFEAVARIKESCDVVVKLEEVQKDAGGSIFSRDLSEPLTISLKSLSLLCSQFSILLKAGLPTSKVVKVIAGQTSDKYLKKILLQVAEDTAAGYSLAQSFESRTDKMPVSFVETIRAGEASGTLEHSFAKLAAYYEKSYRISAKVRNAMVYPACLMILAIVVVIVVVNVAVPAISGYISDSGGALPGITQALLNIYDFFGKWWWAVLAVLMILFVAFRVYKNTEAGHIKTADMKLNLPVLGRINRLNVASQFSSTMTTLLAAGLPVATCLNATGRVLDNYAAGRHLIGGVMGIEEGKRLAEVFKDSPYLPELLVEMTGVGEESGSLEETLTTIGGYYDSEVEESTTKAMSLLEPAITVFMGVVIGFIVIALYMPMFTMYM